MRKTDLPKIFNEVFQISLTFYLILLLQEMIKQGFVTNFFDPNIVLAVVLVSGVVTATFDKEEKVIVKSSRADWVWVVVFSLVCAAIIFYKTRELGFVSLVISLAGGLIVLLLSYLTLTGEDKS